MSRKFIPKEQQLWDKRLQDLALVRQAAIESPLIEVPSPVEGNNKVLLKLELAQKIKSFKIRGATYAMASDLEKLKKRGVVADSGGNHAQAVALAGNKLGVPVHIVMASVVPETKKAASQKFGATDGTFELDTTPPTFVDAKVKAKNIAKEEGKKYLSPYDDPAIVRGTATIVPEVVQQLTAKNLPLPDAMYVPIGGGGLISGIADVNAEQGHLFDLYGAGMTGADSAARSFHSAEPTPVEGDPNVIVEGLAVKVIGNEGHQRMKDRKIDDVYTVELADAGEAYDWYKKNVLPVLGIDTNDEEAVWNALPELSSMVAVASMFKHIRETGAHNQTQLVLISGGNIDRVKIGKAMDAYRQRQQSPQSQS